VRFYGLYVALAAFSLAGCPPPTPPAPVPLDATDASPAPMPASDASTPCQAACDRLSLLCGSQPADCVTVYANIDGRRLVRTSSGAALTCAAVASAVDKPGMAALGITCP
jgi:hypothetical protein